MNLNNPILAVLSSIYYVCMILPKSLITKNSEGRKLFNLKKKPSGSYFHERNHEYGKADFEKG
jgi:hypothetical protein